MYFYLLLFVIICCTFTYFIQLHKHFGVWHNKYVIVKSKGFGPAYFEHWGSYQGNVCVCGHFNGTSLAFPRHFIDTFRALSGHFHGGKKPRTLIEEKNVIGAFYLPWLRDSVSLVCEIYLKRMRKKHFFMAIDYIT